MSRVELALNVGASGPRIPWEIYTVLADTPQVLPERGGCGGS
jgi:hypothetical protein